MAKAVSVTVDLSGAALRSAPRAGLLVVLAAALGGASILAPDVLYRLAMVTAAVTLCGLAIALRFVAAWRRSQRLQGESQIAALVEEDATPCFSTDTEGEIDYQNAAAVKRFSAENGQSLASALGDHFVSPGAVLYRLQSRAAAKGAAREDVVTRRGHTRLSVHRIGEARFLWRLEEMLERTSPGRGAETLSLPMLVANKSGVVLFMNEAMRRLLGGRPRQLDRIFVNPALRSGEEALVTTLDGPVRAILAEIEGPGERRELYLLPLPERHETGELHADFDHLPVALALLDLSGKVMSANIAAREMLHAPEGSDQRLPDLLDGLGRSIADWIADVFSERHPGGAEVLRLRNVEPETFIQVRLRRTVDNGRTAVLAVLEDATALKTLEAQFTQSQKMLAIGQFAGGIAHDFNNLLTAISGHTDLLLMRHDRNGPEYADLIQIRQNSNRAAGLVGQLLAFSRKQTLRPQLIDLHEVLSDLTHLLNRLVGERTHLELHHANQLGKIRADKRQLEQVLMNLVVNARDAMPEGGAIVIETEQIDMANELRRDRAVVPAGRYVVIRVRDTGCGIPPDRLEKIFEPFYTTKRPGEGTGLGLSTAYGIVKQSGGFIFVDSILNEGSTFVTYFPVHAGSDVDMEEQTAVAARMDARQKPTRVGQGVVLLVEDEAPVRAVASRALRMRGYTVLEAENAEVALALLDDPSVEVDIFVTDVVMPGMDGPSWVRKALESRPNVKVVFVSGYAEDSFADTQERIANSVFLPKPFSLNELTATVQGQLLH